MTDPHVHVRSCPAGRPEQIEQAVEALFAALPAAGALHPGSKVLIKPNLLARFAPGKAVTTDPAVLRAVILAVQRRGAAEITVADSPGGPYSPALMEATYKGCGIAAVCAETGARLYTACESAPKPSGGRLVKSFELIRPALDCDFIVSIPKLKTHVLTGMSGAVKNTFGCVPGMQKAEFHMRFPARDRFGQMLVDLCETVRPNLYILDGLLAMEGDGPSGGHPRRCDLLAGAENPYHMDLAICRLIGMDPAEVPTLAAAVQNGLCAPALADELLLGDEAAMRSIPGFALPASYKGTVNRFGRLPAFLQPMVDKLTPLVAPRPAIVKQSCIGCGKCAEICPEQVIHIQAGKAAIDRKRCIRCFCCHEICPVQAIKVRRVPLFRI